jgi:L-seryl-tRNA(Ser) seleniumtransferase
VSTQPDDRAALRALPAVDALAAELDGVPAHIAVRAAQLAIADARARILSGSDGAAEDLTDAARSTAQRLLRPSLRRVINATGTVLHTNLGRAPLAPDAIEAAAAAATGYANLELDLDSGRRGHRADHISELLRELTGAEAATAVNNNAAAVLLALAALAADREVIVSRGELVEIGGSFRIPEIMALSGARLVEVGTTNRTRLADYESAITGETAALLRVHQSHFRTVGFVEQAPLDELAALARDRGIALIDDLGSGALQPVADEPLVRASVAAGSTLVCFSADKLLGGPQAGIICGTAEAVGRCATHPLARALRLDKMQLAALEATLRLQRDDSGAIPALAMLGLGEAELERRARSIATAIGEPAEVIRTSSVPGGGSLPLVELEGPACAVAAAVGADELARRLRDADPPVIARIEADRLILDPRTLLDDEEVDLVGRAVVSALG